MASTTSIVKTTMTTIVPITFHPKPIYVIVATALNPSMGIGNRGTLPWSGIKGDMAFFRKLTTKVPESSTPGALNALIMGRKTWESIPTKFRPLPGRLNVVITRGKVKELGRRILDELQASSDSWEAQDLLLSTAATPSKAGKNDDEPSPANADATVSTTVLLTPSSTPASSAILISSSLPRTISLLSSSNPLPNTTVTPHKVFCIGGANLYSQILALSHVSPAAEDDDADLSPTTTREETQPQNHDTTSDDDSTAFDIRILQTQVHKLNGEAFECDTFFPEDITFSSSTSDWRAVSQRTLEGWTDGVDIPGSSPASAFDFNSSTAGAEDRKPPSDDEVDGWVRDDKAGVEYRVVGWERR